MKVYFIYDTEKKNYKYTLRNSKTSWHSKGAAKCAWNLHWNTPYSSNKDIKKPRFNEQTRYVIHELKVNPSICKEVR
jgi:hypothetical protein